MSWDEKRKNWIEDEWLCRICGTEQLAKEMLLDFAEGRPFDNDQEIRVTRCFGKRKNPFIRGEELDRNNPNATEREWMRYAVFQVA